MRRLVSTPLTRNMGCGRSRPGCSPDNSDTEGQGSAGQPAGQGATNPRETDKKRGVEGKSSTAGETTSAKNASNGASNKSADKQQTQKQNSKNGKNSPAVESSSASPAKGGKSHSSSRSQPGQYVLEVPQDVYTKTQNKGSKHRGKDNKTPKSPKVVHATTSQLEFFKMLDEKIEMGGENKTSSGVCNSSDISDSKH